MRLPRPLECFLIAYWAALGAFIGVKVGGMIWFIFTALTRVKS